ncbi:hypothetical protein HMN09_00786000 [Mycena chlorophos]|uniref:F-box domain-containing protein n=1 Tax=Mycena chlorophos TaxID=658473 RepID=A0A8H6W733_MYCCL|nr:hypothetical protein HMN09_00786000 [Mycena chlorophos]
MRTGVKHTALAIAAGARGSALWPAMAKDFNVWETTRPDIWPVLSSIAVRSQPNAALATTSVFDKLPTELLLQILISIPRGDLLKMMVLSRGVFLLLSQLLDEVLWHHVHYGDLHWLLPVPSVPGEVERAAGIIAGSTDRTRMDSREFPFAAYLPLCSASDSMRNRARLWNIAQQFRIQLEIAIGLDASTEPVAVPIYEPFPLRANESQAVSVLRLEHNSDIRRAVSGSTSTTGKAKPVAAKKPAKTKATTTKSTTKVATAKKSAKGSTKVSTSAKAKTSAKPKAGASCPVPKKASKTRRQDDFHSASLARRGPPQTNVCVDQFKTKLPNFAPVNIRTKQGVDLCGTQSKFYNYPTDGATTVEISPAGAGQPAGTTCEHIVEFNLLKDVMQASGGVCEAIADHFANDPQIPASDKGLDAAATAARSKAVKTRNAQIKALLAPIAAAINDVPNNVIYLDSLVESQKTLVFQKVSGPASKRLALPDDSLLLKQFKSCGSDPNQANRIKAVNNYLVNSKNGEHVGNSLAVVQKLDQEIESIFTTVKATRASTVPTMVETWNEILADAAKLAEAA